MKPFFFFAAVMALLAMLVATAPAAPTQSWNDFLADFGIDPASPQTIAHTKIVGRTEEALGVALSVEGLFYNGETFVLGMRTENLRPELPALVLYTRVAINGESVSAEADHPISIWYPRIFELSPAGDPINNLMSAFRAYMEGFSWKGEVEISAYFIVVRPTKPIVIVDAEIYNAYDHADMENDRQAMLANLRACGVTIAEAGDTDAGAWREKGYLVLNRYGGNHLEELKTGEIWDISRVLYEIDPEDAERQEVIISFHINLDDLET